MNDNIDKKSVGLRIKSIRQEKGMTLEEFGKLFGAGKGLVSRWENGLSTPNAERLKAIAKIGDISVEELLQGTSISFKVLKNYLTHNPRIIQEKLETETNKLIKKWFEPSMYDDYGTLDLTKRSYAIKLFGRMVLYTEIQSEIEDEFERRIKSRNKVVKEISNFLFQNMQEKDLNEPWSFVTELNLINRDLEYSDSIFELILNAMEEISKENKQLVGFILTTKIGNLSDEINRFLSNKNYKNLKIQQYGAYKDPAAIIDSIDHNTYKEIQKQLIDVLIYTRKNLTDKFN